MGTLKDSGFKFFAPLLILVLVFVPQQSNKSRLELIRPLENSQDFHAVMRGNLQGVPVSAARQSGMSRETFFKVVETVFGYFQRDFTQRGLIFQPRISWENPAVNAEAKLMGRVAIVDVFGGLARYPGMNTDTLALVLCHEIGHHLGGAPIVMRHDGEGSDEGQADYFATSKCMRRIFYGTDQTTYVQSQRNQNQSPQNRFIFQQCQRKYQRLHDQAVCARTGQASVRLTEIIANILNSENQIKINRPSLVTPDRTVQAFMLEGYPSVQCRLDTLWSGALCDVDFNQPFSGTDLRVGACNIQRSDISGTRPACWFSWKPAPMRRY